MSEYPVEGEDGSRTQFYVPEGMEEGAYAETMAVWHTANSFVIDFGTYQVAQADPDDPATIVTPVRVVSRVRLPVAAIFEIIRTINGRLEQYEQQFGEVPQPQLREDESEGESD